MTSTGEQIIHRHWDALQAEVPADQTVS